MPVDPVRSSAGQCTACWLKARCIPAGLDKEQESHVAALIRPPAQIQGKQELIAVGDTFRGLFAVRQGTLMTQVLLESGQQKVVSFHLPGDLLGIDGILLPTHLGRVVALENSMVCQIPYEQMLETLAGMGQAQRHLHRVLVSQIKTTLELAILVEQHADRRLSGFLAGWIRRLRENGFHYQEFTLRMSRVDLANYLALTPETLSRAFTKLAEQGVLEYRNRLIRILRLDLLSDADGAL